MKRIGILTYHRANNFGAVWQAAALQEAIRMMGEESEIIDYRCEKIEQDYHSPSTYNGLKGNLQRILVRPWQQRTKDGFDHFRRDCLSCSAPVASRKAVQELCKRYYALITGSDQVLNPMGSGYDSVYYLDIGNAHIAKYAYAASFGRFLKEEKATILIEQYLKDFIAVGVREEEAARFIKGIFPKKEIKRLLDPVFLPKECYYQELAASYPVNGEYLLLYLFCETKELVREAVKLSRRLHCQILYITNAAFCPPFLHPVKGVGPREFLWLFLHAKGVLTDSFHGTAFAIYFQKPFLSITRDGDCRITGLLEELGLIGGVLKIGEDQPLCNPGSMKTRKILTEWRRDSFAFLEKMILTENCRDGYMSNENA